MYVRVYVYVNVGVGVGVGVGVEVCSYVGERVYMRAQCR